MATPARTPRTASAAPPHPNAAAEAGTRLLIERPAPNTTHVIDLGEAKTIVFTFPLSQARIALYDVDLVLIFPDGGKIVLPGFALALAAGADGPDGAAEGDGAPAIIAAGEPVDPQALLSLVGEMRLADRSPHLTVTDLADQGDQPAQAGGPGEAEPMPLPLRVSNLLPPEEEAQAEEAPVEVRVPRTEPFTDPFASPSSSRSGQDAAEPAPPGPPVPEPPDSALAVRLLANTGQSRESLPGGGERIVGGFGAEDAASDPSFAAQATPEFITGTPEDDIIVPDDVALVPPGYALRMVEIEVIPSNADAVATEVRLSGLPAGFSLLDLPGRGGVHTLAMGADAPNIARFGILYPLPTDGARPNAAGFFAKFDMTLDFTLTSTAGQSTLSTKQAFAVGSVQSDADMYRADPATGRVTAVLFHELPGNGVDAGDGDDLIYSSSGADEIDGGSGNDLVSYLHSARGVTVDLATGTSSDGDTLLSIEHVIGSDFADRLIGDGADNVLRGGDGNDSLAGGRGGDTLVGGAGVDIADYSAAADPVGLVASLKDPSQGTGDAKGDLYSGLEGLRGSAFDDRLVGDDADNGLEGGSGNDVLVGGLGRDRLAGDAGTDVVDYSGSSAVTVDLAGTGSGGEAEGDTYASIEGIIGSSFGDRLTGNDAANLLDGRGGDDTLDGGDGNDRLDGGAGADTFDGGDGDDVLIGGAGADVLNGGLGFDTVDYSASASSTVNFVTGLGGGANSTIDSFGDTLSGIEIMIGSAGADRVTAGGALIAFSGGAGNDTLVLTGTSIDFDGGTNTAVTPNQFNATGGDALDFSLSTAVSVDLGLQTASGGFADPLTFRNVENVVGTGEDDQLIGSDGGNWLRGGAGNDTLLGHGGNDMLVGGAGADIVDGGAGTSDLLSYAGSSAGVFVSLRGIASGGDAEGDVITNVEYLLGSSFADTLIGDAGSNALYGGPADRLYGGGGFDLVTEQSIVDFSLGESIDGVDVAFGQGRLTSGVTSSGASGLAYTVDAVASITAYLLTGGGGDIRLSRFDDSITTGNWRTLWGGEGNDTLHAGLSVGSTGTTIYGEAGDDLVVANNVVTTFDGGEGVDTVSYALATGTAGVTIDLGRTAAQTGGWAHSDILLNFENVVGTNNDDTLIATSAMTGFSGGSGIDTIDYSRIGGGVTVALSSDATDHTRVSGVERVIATAGADDITGTSADETIVDLGGDDRFVGSGGRDTLDYSRLAAGAVTVDLVTGTSSGGAGVDSLSGFAHVVGHAGNDTLVGDAGANTLSGFTGGQDRLSGGGGDDLLLVDGSSLLIAGTRLEGDAGTDTARITGDASGVTLSHLVDALEDVEVLDLRGAAGGPSLAFTASSIQAIAGSARLLTVQAGSASVGALASAGETVEFASATSTYTYFDDAQAQIAQLVVA